MKYDEVPLKDIFVDDDFNCRGRLVPMDVTDLMKDINSRTTETNPGLLQPVIVAPNKETEHPWKLLAGFRRYWSFYYLEREKIPVSITDELSEADAKVLNLSENLKRKQLNILQEAKALQRLYDLGISEPKIMEKLGKTRGWVQVRVMLLKLPEQVQREAEAGILSQTAIRDIYSLYKRGGSEAAFKATKEYKTAKEKGKTVDLKKNIKEKGQRHRGKGEINSWLDHILDQLDAGLYSRALAWAAGNISDEEFEDSLRQAAEDQGRFYTTYKEKHAE